MNITLRDILTGMVPVKCIDNTGFEDKLTVGKIYDLSIEHSKSVVYMDHVNVHIGDGLSLNVPTKLFDLW